MLRDNTESFAPDFSDLLKRYGIDDNIEGSYQLLKFERIQPDIFLWLLRGHKTYLVCISDRPGDIITDKKWIGSQWLNHVNEKDIVSLKNREGEFYTDDDFDTVWVYQLADSYDHENTVSI